MAIEQRSLTLAEFLALPEAEPALEREPDGTVSQKVSPKGQHSTLQLALCEQINKFARPRHLALAFPELRTVYAGAANVPQCGARLILLDSLERPPLSPDKVWHAEWVCPNWLPPSGGVWMDWPKGHRDWADVA
jgi:Uma2 family endonuclease